MKIRGSQDPPDVFGWARFYRQNVWQNATPTRWVTSASIAVNTLQVHALFLPNTRRVLSMGFEIITPVIGNARMGIYENGHNVYPSRLIYQTPEVDLNITGVVEVSDINIRLVRNLLYWIAIISSGAATISMLSASIAWGILGHPNLIHTHPNSQWRVGMPYGVLPDSFPLGADAIGWSVPNICFKFSD